jgi:hypothetical protein
LACFSNFSTISNEGAFVILPKLDLYLDQFSRRTVAPAMISATDYGRTAFVFADNREPSVPTDIVEASDGIVLRKDQENWICANIISVISAQILEPATMRDAMPRLISEGGLSKSRPAKI